MDPNTTPADAADKAKNKAQDAVDQAKDKAQDVAGQAKDAATQAKDKAQDLAGQAKDKAQDLAGQAENKAQDVADKAQDLAGQAKDKAQEYGQLAQDKAQELAGKAQDYLKDLHLGEQYDKLSTTQKVVGGAAIALGLTLLLSGGKEKKAKRQAAILEKLLLFVNDRVEGYKRAAAESKDSRYKDYYQHLATQSKDFAATLNGFLADKGGKRETGTTWKGKFYRRYMDAKALVTGRDEKAILDANIYGEEWAVKAYKKALRRGVIKKGGVGMVIKHQFKLSKKTLKQLKELKAKAAA